MIRKLAFLFVFAASAALAIGQSFALHSGDRVVFYGDSITDNQPYTYDAETFVTLRYPKLHVSYMNAGVGGDRVTGGWMGPIDQRMTRDLFSRKPTVITIMLGMNDASYTPFRQDILDTYENGYNHMADRIQKEAPDARVWLFQPSPFDDVTRKPNWDPGYNDVLKKYAAFVAQLADQRHFSVVDQNTPMDDMLEKADAMNPDEAQKLIPDRIHPGPAGHLVMTDQLLQAWHASPLVSVTKIDWRAGTGTSENADLGPIKNGTFTLLEHSLPYPFDRKDGQTQLVLACSTVAQDMNTETLQVDNMPQGTFSLSIDGKQVGSFSTADFAAGIDLSKLDTPMIEQAQKVQDMTNQIGNLRYNRWRQLEFNLQDYDLPQRKNAIKAVENLESALEDVRYKDAQPVSHTFQITQTG